MYQIALSSTVADDHNLDTDYPVFSSHEYTYEEPLAMSSEDGFSLGALPKIMAFSMLCFVGLLSFGAYQLFAPASKSKSEQVAAVDFQEVEPLKPITSYELRDENYIVPIKREFAYKPEIDMTITASVDKETASSSVKTINDLLNDKAEELSLATYTIQPGDTLSGIASKHNIKQSLLVELNSIKDASKIKPGMKLIVRKAD